jgi:hypothetical protein
MIYTHWQQAFLHFMVKHLNDSDDLKVDDGISFTLEQMEFFIKKSAGTVEEMTPRHVANQVKLEENVIS